jgi:endonuclease-3
MKPADIEGFFATLKAANPSPVTELEYTSVFELLAAVLLSAQATDIGVNKATRRLFPVANTPRKILDLGLADLEGYIKTIGLFRSKARHLMQTCQILVAQHGGVVPRTREALQALPGVGRKTANVVLNVAFGEPWGWTPICFGWAIAPAWRPARRRWKWSTNCSNASRPNTWWTPTTG